MTLTDQTKTPKVGVNHAHGLSQVEQRIQALEAKATAQGTLNATILSRLAALETPDPEPPPPTGAWFGLADPWAGIPFGSRPLAPSGPIWITAGHSLSNVTFKNRPAGQNVIVVENAADVVIEDCDFDGVPECIYAFNAQRLIIRRCRVGGAGIFGPFTRTGFHSGNFAQVVNSSGVRVSDIKIMQPPTVPTSSPVPADQWGTEDVISIGGNPGSYGDHVWQRVSIDAGAWKSWSGTGFFVGDGASGRDIVLLDVKLLNPGQCAIGTGEEGPYDFRRIDVKSTRVQGVNTALQLRSPRISMGSVRVDWPTTAVTPGATYIDLGGNDWSADL